MKKLRKPLTISLLSGILMVTGTGMAYADEIDQADVMNTIQSEDFKQVLFTYVQDGETHDCTEEDLRSAYICPAFQVADIDAAGQVDYKNEIWYSPVMKDGKIISLITFVGGDTISCTFSQGYTEILNFLNEMSADGGIQLFSMSGHLYGAANGTVYDLNSGEKAEIICPEIEKIYIQTDNEVALEEDSYIMPSYSIGTLLGSRMVEDISSGKQLKDYPVFAQGSTSLCWAGTIASMVKYEFPNQYSNITIGDVCKAVNHYEGANWDKIKEAMNYYFKAPYVPTYIETPLTRDDVKVVIQNNDPGLMSSLNPSKSSAHITALIGYKDTPSGMSVKIMNPGTGALEWGYYSTSAFSYAYNNETYTWDKTIRLMYR